MRSVLALTLSLQLQVSHQNGMALGRAKRGDVVMHMGKVSKRIAMYARPQDMVGFARV